METEYYDDIVIGSGKAGKTLAPALVADGRKRSVVESMRDMNLHHLETALGHEPIVGTGRFVAPKIVEVIGDGTNRLLTAKRLFINTGIRPTNNTRGSI